MCKLGEICLWLHLAVKGLRPPRHDRESETVLDSGFQAVDSGFFLSVELGFRIPWAEFRIPQFWNIRITLHGAIRLLSCIFLLCCSFYYIVFIRLNAADGSKRYKWTLHLIKRLRRLFEDTNKKKTRYNLVIYTIQTIMILSQQNKRDIETFKVHNI